MDYQNEKCVMVMDEQLPVGMLANTAAILGITLGQKLPEVVGDDGKHSRNGSLISGPCHLRQQEARKSAHRQSAVAALRISLPYWSCLITQFYH